ncbi:hypothetical protein HVZ54_13290 [Escherichia coli]|nr:hypothetical protein [Escherichia coli]
MFTGDRGGEIRHRLARDAAGRLTAKETADSHTEYVHDAADQLLEIRRRRSDAGNWMHRRLSASLRQTGADAD